MVLIYIHKSTTRLQYIAAFIFKELIKVPYAITTHKQSFNKFEEIKLNYTDEQIGTDELRIPNCDLLNQTGVQPFKIDVFEYKSNKAFFRSSSQNDDEYAFDIFSAIFYLLSRYEEYLPHDKDEYGRYSHINSLAFKNNFLKLPLINIWVKDFTEWIKNKKKNFQPQESYFKFHPTYDIDIAYSYLNKGFVRNAFGSIQSVLALNGESLAQRFKVLSRVADDPFDNFDWLHDFHERYSLTPFYFFLVASKNGLYDKNILPEKKAMQQLISKHAEKYKVGLHPSWQSGDDLSLLRREKETLEKLSQTEISKSRYHYIHFNLPGGYSRLIDTGITDEYSMGYGDINGFRASVAYSFFWYDLEKEVPTKLRIHPYCYMDSTAIYNEKLSVDEAYNEMLYFFNTCKKFHGTCITIFHNHLLGSDKMEWRQVYEKFIYEIVSVGPGNNLQESLALQKVNPANEIK